MSTASIHTGVDRFVKQFTDVVTEPLKGIRTEALESFSRLGFPGMKNEEWKYTNVAPIAGEEFVPAQSGFALTVEKIRGLIPAGLDAVMLVFENGRLNKELSSTETEGFIAGNLRDHQEHPAVKEHLGKYAPFRKESFIALNTAFLDEGAFVFIPQGMNVEKTIHILFVSDSSKAATVNYPRNLVVASENSRCKIFQSFHSLKSINHSFTNMVTEVITAQNADVEMTILQAEQDKAFHIAHIEVYQQRNSLFNIHTFTLGGSIVRNNLHIVLDGENSTAYLNGLYAADANEHFDNHTLVDHAKPQCYSNELYKGLLDGNSRGIFNGKIFVRRDAQKTNAYQSNKNILLSDDASMNAKPQLEIFADDVKCSHGATTGQLDHEAVFYLRSRGIGIDAAKALLNTAFAGEITSKITTPPVREHVNTFITNKLHKEGA